MEAKTNEIKAGKVLREHALREAELVQRESQIRGRLLKLEEELFGLSKQDEEVAAVQQNLNEIALEIREREHSAKHLSEQIHSLQSQVQMVEATVRARHSADNNRIRSELTAVLESRRDVLAELKLVGAEQALLVNRRLMLVADIESLEIIPSHTIRCLPESRYREQAESVSQQEELERFVKEFGAGDPCISVLQQQGQLEEELRQLETEIDLVEQQSKEMSSESIRTAQKKVDSECRSLKSRISAGLKLRDEKMLRLKRELDLVLEGVGNAFRLEGLGDSIVGKLREVVGYIGRGIEVEMMREQVKSTLIEEESLRTSYHQRILALRDLTINIAPELRGNSSDEILQNFTEKFHSKIQGFVEWRNSLAKVLVNNEGSGDYKSIYKLFTDQKLERQLQKELSQMIDWNEEYASKVEKLLNLLTEYSKIAGEKGKEFLHEKKNLELLEVESYELEAQLQIEKMRSFALESRHHHLMRKRVDIAEELAEIRMVLERDLTEQVETIFKLHEIQKVSEYKHLQRTYGSRCLERRVLEQKAEILHSVIQEKRNMLQRVSEQQQALTAHVSKATQMLQSVEQELLPELRRTECILQDVQQGQIGLQTRDRQLLNSEEELVQFIGELEALEEVEVKDEMSKIEAVGSKLQALMNARASLEEEMKASLLKKEGLECQIKAFHQKTLEIEAEVAIS